MRWFNATAWYGMFLGRLLIEAGHDVLVLGLPGTLSARKGEEWGLPMRLMDLNTTTPWGIAALYAELKALANYLASVEGDLQVVPQSRFR